MKNLSKDLILHGRIETTLQKAKFLKRDADKLVTLGKKKTLHSKRLAIQKLGIHYNALTPKEARRAKEGDTSSYNTDRKVIDILFDQIAPRLQERAGGYTRIVPLGCRVGDGASLCIIEYL